MENNNVKLLGVKIDNELKFVEHISTICITASRKLSALTRLSRFLPSEKRCTLFKAFIESRFRYCPLVWMFHGRQTNHKSNNLHERALIMVYNDCLPSFQDLLNKDNSLRIHHQNIQSLTAEIYKTFNNLHCQKSIRIRAFSGPYFPVFTPYLSVFSPNVGKYGPEKLQIRTPCTQCYL